MGPTMSESQIRCRSDSDLSGILFIPNRATLSPPDGVSHLSEAHVLLTPQNGESEFLRPTRAEHSSIGGQHFQNTSNDLKMPSLMQKCQCLEYQNDLI